MKPEVPTTVPGATKPMDPADPAHPSNRPPLTEADAAADLSGTPRPKRKRDRKPKAKKPEAPPKAKRTIARFSLLQWIAAREDAAETRTAIDMLGDAFREDLRVALATKPLDVEKIDAQIHALKTRVAILDGQKTLAASAGERTEALLHRLAVAVATLRDMRKQP